MCLRHTGAESLETVQLAIGWSQTPTTVAEEVTCKPGALVSLLEEHQTRSVHRPRRCSFDRQQHYPDLASLLSILSPACTENSDSDGGGEHSTGFPRDAWVARGFRAEGCQLRPAA
jgi:hypothetical protein